MSDFNSNSQFSKTTIGPNDAKAISKAALVERMKADCRSQYQECMKLHEILACLRDMLGDPGKEQEIHFTDSGLCGLRHIFNDLAARAENAMCDGVYPQQIDRLAAMGEQEHGGRE